MQHMYIPIYTYTKIEIYSYFIKKKILIFFNDPIY